MKLLDKFTRGFSKEALLEELNVHETMWTRTNTMSEYEAKSRSIKELKAKKHHEKLSLLRASVKEIVHREKMEPQFVILFGSYARGDFNGFSDVDLIVVDHNRDQAERLACSIQEQGLADDVLTLNSEEWSQKKKSDSFFWKSILQESICLYEHSWKSMVSPGGRRFEDGEACFCKRYFIPKPATMPHSPLKRRSRVSSSIWVNCPPKPVHWIVWRECCPNLGCIPPI